MTAPTPLLADRTVVVTGGFGVLGRAVAAAALAASARVAVIDQGPTPSPLEPGILAIPDTDLAAFGAAQQAFVKIEAEYGPVDALLNIAGAFEWCVIHETDADLWIQLYSANVLTVVNACRAARQLLCPGAAIVNVSAAAARRGTRGMAAYAAAKSGVLRLTEALAEEWQPAGIRVNAVSPTIIDTPRNRVDMPDADFNTWVKPEALARTMLWLASEASEAVNGADVRVDGSRSPE